MQYIIRVKSDALIELSVKAASHEEALKSAGCALESIRNTLSEDEGVLLGEPEILAVVRREDAL